MLRKTSSLFVLFTLAIFVGAPNASCQRPAAQPEKPEAEKHDIEQLRSEWFYGQRAYPHQYVPARARLKAIAQLNSLETLAIADGAGSGLHWTSLGPQPVDTPYSFPVVSGRVSALVMNPTNTNVLYLGGAQGGVWESTNAGKSWTILNNNEPSLATGSIALDPTNPNMVYVGTGEENLSGDSYYGAGILKSTDGGNTWEHYCGPFCGPVGQDGYYGGGARIGGIVVDPANNQVLLAAVALLFEDGIYRSTDGGQTWTQVLSGNPGTAVLFNPTGTTAYAAMGSSFSGGTEGVYVSNDGGQTWTADNGSGANSLPLSDAARIVLAVAPSNPATLYAGIANVNDGSLLGVYKTTNGGNTWTLTSALDYCDPQCSYDNVIAVSPTNPNIIFAGGAFTTTLIRSLDGGNTWSILQSAQNFGTVHADMHALTFTPNGKALYLGNDGGVYVTTQVSASNPAFTPLNSTLSITQFYPGLSVNGTAFAVGGTQDNGTEIYSGSLTWNQVTCGDGGYTAIDSLLPSTVYATCQEIFIEKSTQGGNPDSWNESDSGIDQSDRVDFIPPFTMDPEETSTLYFGTFRVYQTTDGAVTWNPISPDLTNGPSFWGIITSISVSPVNSNTVYAGTGDSNVQVTTNAGAGTSAIWTNITGNGVLPPRVITQVLADPKKSTTAYVTFSGFTGFGDSLGHVFRTTNGGTSWMDITSNLPNTPVNAIVVNPSNTSEMAVGTDVGVFYSVNSGKTWTPLVAGLPTVAVLGLTYDPATQTLWAATHGRGVWSLHI